MAVRRTYRDRDELVDVLREALAEQADVVAAYLYGSQARGTTGPLSDVDVAVLLGDDTDRSRRWLELASVLTNAVGDDLDLVVLNDAPAPLAYRVLRDGIVVLSRDERARIHHWTSTVREYLDTALLREAARRGLRHRIEEGRFGRPRNSHQTS